MRPAVFLDRDGVLTESIARDGVPAAPLALEEMRIVPGAAAALALLKSAGYLLIVVSNQPDVARGILPPGILASMHRALRAALPVDDVFVCPHDDRDRCACRKPLPGLLLAAAEKYAVDLARSWMIGDRWRDVDAGTAAGCRTVLIDYGYRERPPQTAPHAVVASLEDAVSRILSEAG